MIRQEGGMNVGTAVAIAGLVMALIVQAGAFVYTYGVFTTRTDYRLMSLEVESQKMRNSIDKLTLKAVPKE